MGVQRGRIVGNRYWIAVGFFLLAAAPGCWFPVLSNVLHAKGWGPGIIEWAFVLPPLAGMLSPLAFAAKADRSYPAEKVLFVVLAGGAIFLFLAFWFLEHSESPVLFLTFLGINALVSAPAWSLLTSVALSNLEDTARQFGSYRVWGTVGWVAAGWSVSWLGIDQSASTGMMASGVRIFAGFACLCLPHTPPRGGASAGWMSSLGFDSLKVLKDRDQAVYFLTAFLFSIPLAAFYMHTPRHLADLGVERVAAAMTWGQVSEVASLMLLGYVLMRWRLKFLLLFAIGCGVLRYGLYAWGGSIDYVLLILIGVGMHGFAWTFFFESGRVFVDRRVEPGMRAQTQALLTLVSGGLGAGIGTTLVGGLYRWLVVGHGAAGWTTYWWVLSGMCALTGLVFAIGYKGLAVAPKAPDVPVTPVPGVKP